MCATPFCCARLTRSNFNMLWNQLLTVLAWLWFYCWMHFNCIYRCEVLQLIFIRFNVMMPLSNPTMNNVCKIPFIFICVHNTILFFSSYHVPMFSLLVYFFRNDKNEDDQSLYNTSLSHICYLDNGKSLIRQQNIDKTNAGFVSPGHQKQNSMLLNSNWYRCLPLRLTYLS